MSYYTNREWADKWISQIKSIVGPFLLVESSFEEDTQEVSDLVVLKCHSSITIACRVRRPGFAERYPNQFTIRHHLDNGMETEFSKIMNRNFGSYMFYGHANGSVIDPWMIINLNSFRDQIRNPPTTLRYDVVSNGDGTHFIWFDACSFAESPKLVTASSRPLFPRKVKIAKECARCKRMCEPEELCPDYLFESGIVIWVCSNCFSPRQIRDMELVRQVFERHEKQEQLGLDLP